MSEETTKTKMPEVSKNNVTIQFTEKDLASLIKLLSSGRDVYARIALNAVDQGDSSSAEIFKARAELSEVYAEILSAYSSIGEPESRDIH